MTPKQMAGLRALAETASGVVLVCNRHDVLALLDEVERLREALIRLRDCDWVITPLDRMDAVRDIARAALGGAPE